MATPLTDKINALTSAANETTGASDTTLGDAVATLIAGYGGGSGGLSDIDIIQAAFHAYDLSTYSIGEFTLESDESGSYFTIPNPADAVPVNIFVIRKDWLYYATNETVIGAYNIGNVTSDNDAVNRLVWLTGYNTSYPFPSRTFVQNIYSAKNSSCPSDTSDYVYLRAGDNARTKWLAGTYIIAVSTS